MIAWSTFLSQLSPSTGGTDLWTQFGPMAIVFVILSAAYWDVRRDRDRYRAELKETNKQLIDTVVPLSVRLVELLHDLAAERRTGRDA